MNERIVNSDLSLNVKDVAIEIGKYYLAKCDFDYAEAADKIRHQEIHKIEVLDEGDGPCAVTIHTSRPGMLIGRRGENIRGLEEHLRMPVHIVEVRDCLLNYLIPQEPYDDYWDHEPIPDDEPDMPEPPPEPPVQVDMEL